MGRAQELDDRIAWVLANRPHLIVRGEASQREWSRLAKHPDGSPFGLTQVNQIRLRIKNWLADPSSGPEPSFELETLEALADAAKVNRAWFVQGIGTPDLVTTTLEERYHAMPAVRAMGRAEGYDETFVSSWQAELDADDQPTADELWNLMKSSWARLQRKTRVLGDPTADLDEPPPVRTARKKR